jgi:hypothetical protein
MSELRQRLSGEGPLAQAARRGRDRAGIASPEGFGQQSTDARKLKGPSRRRYILEAVEDEVSSHTSALAFMCCQPVSTARRDLDWLEREGLVVGTKHDERNIDGGRIRIYWSITDVGREELRS